MSIPILQSFNAVSGVLAGIYRITSCSACNRNASVRYLQLFDLATIPGNQAVPFFQVAIAGGTLQTLIGTDYFGASGVKLVNGISYGFSTTTGTYTAATATDHDFNAPYIGPLT